MEGLLKKNQEAQSMIELLTAQIEILKKNGVTTNQFETEGQAILQENRELAEKIAFMKTEIMKTELVNGEIQVTVPTIAKCNKPMQMKPEEIKPVDTPKPVEIKAAAPTKPAAKVEQSKEDKKSKKPATDQTEVIDVSRFDMRIGRIMEISKHPEADTLYIEQVDIGEAKPRQIISGLVNFCSEKDLLGRLAVFLVNLKPAKMRGVMSEGMIMCASAPERGMVEPLIVPDGVKPGDRVTVDGYDGPADDVMNPKKKILETVKPELRVDAAGIATYRGSCWKVNGQVGSIRSTKLTDAPIS